MYSQDYTPVVNDVPSYVQPVVKINFVLYSYTVQNILDHTLISTKTQLGSLDDELYSRLFKAVNNINNVHIPDNLDPLTQKLVDISLGMGGGIFQLHMEIQEYGHDQMDIQIIGGQMFHDSILMYM